MKSDLDLRCFRFDLLQAEEIPLPSAGTFSLYVVPYGFAFEIRFPEGPGATLDGTDRIDCAAPFFWIEKRTVSIGKIFERAATGEELRVLDLDRTDRLVKKFGDLVQLLIGNPNYTGCTGAAIAAACALES